jgi:hypothetical protein
MHNMLSSIGVLAIFITATKFNTAEVQQWRVRFIRKRIIHSFSIKLHLSLGSRWNKCWWPKKVEYKFSIVHILRDLGLYFQYYCLIFKKMKYMKRPENFIGLKKGDIWTESCYGLFICSMFINHENNSGWLLQIEQNIRIKSWYELFI